MTVERTGRVISIPCFKGVDHQFPANRLLFSCYFLAVSLLTAATNQQAGSKNVAMKQPTDSRQAAENTFAKMAQKILKGVNPSQCDFRLANFLSGQPLQFYPNSIPLLVHKYKLEQGPTKRRAISIPKEKVSKHHKVTKTIPVDID